MIYRRSTCSPTLTTLVILIGAASLYASPITTTSYHMDLPDGLLTDVDAAFPGNSHLDEMDPTLFTNNANLTLSEPSNITLTFLDDNAAFHTPLGYFTYDNQGNILDQAIIFDDFSKGNPADGYLTAGDSFEFGPFDAGTNVGFYIIPNGNQTPLYSLNSLNPNEDNYTAYYYDDANQMGILGFEDLRWKSETGTGYNDAIVGISTSTVPEPMTISLLAIGGMGVLFLRKRKLV